MKYITSTLDYEFTILGTLIPKARYTPEEVSRGKRLILALEEKRYEDLIANVTFKDLVENNRLMVTDEKPAEKMTETEAQNAAMELEGVKRDLAEAYRLLAAAKDGSESEAVKALREKLNESMEENKKMKEEMRIMAARSKGGKK